MSNRVCFSVASAAAVHFRLHVKLCVGLGKWEREARVHYSLLRPRKLQCRICSLDKLEFEQLNKLFLIHFGRSSILKTGATFFAILHFFFFSFFCSVFYSSFSAGALSPRNQFFESHVSTCRLSFERRSCIWKLVCLIHCPAKTPPSGHTVFSSRRRTVFHLSLRDRKPDANAK